MTEPTIDDLRNLKDGDLYTNDSTVRRALINLLESGGGGADPSEGVQNPLTEDLVAGGYTILGLPVYANSGEAPSTGAAASVGTVDNIAQEAASAAVSSANSYTDSALPGAISAAVSQANTYTDNQLPGAISDAVDQANSYTDSALPGAVSQANTYTDNQIGALQLPTSGTSDLTFDSGASSNADSATGTVYWTRIGDIVTLHAEVEVAATDEGPVGVVMTLSGSAPTPPGTHFGSGAIADMASMVSPVRVGASGASFEIDFAATGGGVFEGAFTLTFQV